MEIRQTGGTMGKEKKQDPPSGAEKTFEQALADLELTVRQLEQGTMGLDASLEAYQKALQTLRFCYQQLEEAERKIELLKGVAEDGTPETTPFHRRMKRLAGKVAAAS
jgi:exodeoxyribonuclease VII small subunit